MALDILYAGSSSAPETVQELREMLGSLEAQLVSLYEEKEQDGDRRVPEDETLTALYEDKQRLSARTVGELQATVESLTAQLADLYEEREQSAFSGELSSLDQQSMLATIQSFEEQLHTFYSAQADSPYALGEAVAMVHSLEAQVAALLEERNDLAADLDRSSTELTTAKRRAREIVNAVLDQSFN